MTENTTPSGIFLPEPEGHPITQLQFDAAGVVLNIAGDPADVVAAILDTYDLGPGASPVVELTEPMFGTTLYLMPAGIERVLSVSRAYATKVDPRTQGTKVQRASGRDLLRLQS